MERKEIAILSGKGGTGKTSLIASMIPYFENLVLADCDVDAPDLHILLDEQNRQSRDFIGLQRPVFDMDKCMHCQECVKHCKFNAIADSIELIASKCEGCGVCQLVCPVDAIKMEDYVVGKIFASDTKYGELVHARLIPGEETSGKLVSEVRKTAKQLADEKKRDWILIDGSPGIACNVISSVTGVSKVILVIEPTLSGLHDLKKIVTLVQGFRIPLLVVLNKSDLSVEGKTEIQGYCQEIGIEIALEIPFEKNMVAAIVNREMPSIYDRAFFDRIGFDQFIKRIKE
jgi:MinD superfamily P-loop ATPase